jgi:quercetin dioxygenase-like cupin family protein
VADGYEILSLDDVEPVPYHQRGGQKLLGIERRLGFRAAGINGWVGDAGEPLVPKHAEDDEEELYVVVRGRATFTVDGEEVDAPAGTLVHLRAGEWREAVAAEDGTLIVAVGGTPGRPHEPSGWTDFAAADAYRRAGRLEDGRAAIARMLETLTDAWYAPYNAACFEALAGDSDRAFAHLAEARRRDADSVRKWAQEDPDLDPLRDDPRWQEVVA